MSGVKSTLAAAGRLGMVSDYQFLVLDSLEKVYGKPQPRPHASEQVSALQGERVSCQIAIRPPNGWFGPKTGGLRATAAELSGITAELAVVEHVPSTLTAPTPADDHYDHEGPALLPDVLRPLGAAEEINFTPGQWRALWITLTVAADAPAGKQQLRVRFLDRQNEVVREVQIPVAVVGVPLPKLPLVNTNWLHIDSIAHRHQVEPYSDAGWQMIEKYLHAAARAGVNSVLTPVLTPPLDTAVDHYRRNVQLVDVTVKGDNYQFGFARLDRWVQLCRAAGMTHLELAHLFTQWGGTSAPAVYDVDGNRLFGWDTAATSQEYGHFLSQFVPALRRHLGQVWGSAVLWHVTDEPHGPEQQAHYQKLRAILDPYLADAVIADALSDFDFYESGAVQLPIVAVDAVEPFLAANARPLWVYYCTAQSRQVSNRFLGMPSYRTRVIGWQLFRFSCAGFLHWGFNFYNTALSLAEVNPFTDTSAGNAFHAGDPFIVYPGPDGQVWESLRARVLEEAMNDVRALTLLSDLAGRDHAEQLIDPDGTLAFDVYPHYPEIYVRTRDQINSLIAERIGAK